MAYENVRLRKPNFTIVDGYFWMFDEDTDSIVVKTHDGTLAYSYPLDSAINETVRSVEYDGYNVWTLRNTGTDQMTIDRWHISNYVCTLRGSFDLVAGPSHKYNSEAFTVEHYHTTFGANETSGSSILSVDDGSNMGSGYVLVLGPNSFGQMEEVTVNSASPSSVSINGSITYSYDEDDPISFYKTIWLFNNYDGIDDTSGALYKLDAYTGSVVAKYSGAAYQNVKACTFFSVPKYIFDRDGVTTPTYHSICYVNGTSLIFLDPDDLTNSFGSMVMDNIEDDQATNIDIFDIVIDGLNVYRLQEKATYYGSTGEFSTYNYQLSTLEPFITSISLRVDPAILPANGVNTSDVTAIVKDQYNLPIEAKQVYFTDDDSNGTILSSPVSTDSDGTAQTIYRAGTSSREVRITSTAAQG